MASPDESSTPNLYLQLKLKHVRPFIKRLRRLSSYIVFTFATTRPPIESHCERDGTMPPISPSPLPSPDTGAEAQGQHSPPPPPPLPLNTLHQYPLSSYFFLFSSLISLLLVLLILPSYPFSPSLLPFRDLYKKPYKKP
ncbi:hypothetical protein E2C01_077701 [Portunus trituberculatus]|uniref:Uncharacterized protein n=1 Tax=Portunus trituberculatus TaxID=210409 RepID=A0A5B7IGP5_PORTR|nr:hypothetical protein [Portunus trituberculatus]